MENIPYVPGMSPLMDVSIALEAASRAVLQVCLIGGCVAIVVIVGLLIAGLVKSRTKVGAAAKGSDQETGISRGGCS